MRKLAHAQKIAIVSPDDFTLVNFRGHLIDDFLSLGVEVHVLAPPPNEGVFAFLKEKGVFCHSLPLKRTGQNPFQDLRYYAFLKRFFKKYHFHKVLAYGVKPIIYTGWSLQNPRTKFYALITGLGYVFGKPKRRLQFLYFKGIHFLYQKALQKAHKVIFQNLDDKALFERKSLVDAAKTYRVNGSGVDLSYYKAELPKTKPFSFLMVSRLLIDKGIVEYLQASAILQQKYPNVKFYLLGAKEAHPNAVDVKVIEKYQKNGVIHYLGECKDVRPIVEAFGSVHVLPSNREGVPRANLEAMSMQRPIITTNSPGCKDTVIDGFNGFEVPVQSVDALVEAMEKFISNPELLREMGQNSRKLAAARFDVHQVNAQMLGIMDLPVLKQEPIKADQPKPKVNFSLV